MRYILIMVLVLNFACTTGENKTTLCLPFEKEFSISLGESYGAINGKKITLEESYIQEPGMKVYAYSKKYKENNSEIEARFYLYFKNGTLKKSDIKYSFLRNDISTMNKIDNEISQCYDIKMRGSRPDSFETNMIKGGLDTIAEPGNKELINYWYYIESKQ